MGHLAVRQWGGLGPIRNNGLMISVDRIIDGRGLKCMKDGRVMGYRGNKGRAYVCLGDSKKSIASVFDLTYAQLLRIYAGVVTSSAKPILLMNFPWADQSVNLE